jgi:AcrR family transcriptional regulator
MGARATAAEATSARILDVALRLFTYEPYEDVSLERIADLAGVTKRTVLRRFTSKDALFLTAMERGAQSVMRRRDEGPVGDVRGLVSLVVDSYEHWGDNRLRVLAQEDRIPVVARNVADGRRFHWSWVERMFAPMLEPWSGDERQRRFAALVALTDVYMWKLLRRDLGLSQRDTERVIVELIGKLEGAR